MANPDMSVAPKHYRPSQIAIPRLPLPAILGFAVAGFGGALFLAYTSFSETETARSFASANDVPVYSARAVPLDSRPEDFAERAISIARALTATQVESQRTETTSEAFHEKESSGSALLPDAGRELRGFSRFSNVGASNSYLALTGTTFGISAQMSPTGFVAADAETAMMSAVPEVSTWLCGAALLALVAGRGIHASWHRKRSESEIDLES